MSEQTNKPDEETLIIKRKPLKGCDGYKTFSIRIKEELVESIDDISVKSGHSRNELIGLFLAYAVSHCRIEEA